MFRAIEINDVSALRGLAQSFYSADNKPAALLCLDHVFRTPPRLQAADDATVSQYLGAFYAYLHLLRSAAVDPNIHTRHSIRKLFALTVAEDETYHSLRNTHLYQLVTKKSWPCLLVTEQELGFSSNQVASYIKQALWGRITMRVAQQEATCTVMKAFSSPCIAHCVYSQCNTQGCNRQHVDVKTVTTEWYSRRVGLHLQEIMILQVGRPLCFKSVSNGIFRCRNLC
jgi:hypothetical protein